MESVSSRRGLCRHIPYICFYITSYFRLAVPLLHKQPIKISCRKHWYSSVLGAKPLIWSGKRQQLFLASSIPYSHRTSPWY